MGSAQRCFERSIFPTRGKHVFTAVVHHISTLVARRSVPVSQGDVQENSSAEALLFLTEMATGGLRKAGRTHPLFLQLASKYTAEATRPRGHIYDLPAFCASYKTCIFEQAHELH